jgi:hypothetical protein
MLELVFDALGMGVSEVEEHGYFLPFDLEVSGLKGRMNPNVDASDRIAPPNCLTAEL